ncbi:hypothetical protein [Agrococcus citreus]|uniref:hypothetical protein n=1 Tax=Agrococcus citreus TaxID=84643 RepID=UPI0031E3EF26
MRRRTRTSTFAVAAALATALALAGCGGGSGPDAGAASDPAISTQPVVEPTSAADAGADADTTAADEERRLLASCESGLLDAFSAEQPERGRIDDQVQVYEAIDMLLPTVATCGISHLQDDGRRTVVMTWFDAPGTGPAVVEGLEAQGWSASTEPADGYDTTTLSDGTTSVEVHPIGLANEQSALGRLWDDVDVTLITVLLP